MGLLKQLLSETSSLGENAFYSMLNNVIYCVDQLNSEPAGLFNAKFGDPSEVLSETNPGLNVSGKLKLSHELSYRNCAVVAPVGAGKSTINAVGTCMNLQNASVIIHAPSEEMVTLTTPDFIRRGFNCYIFDPHTPKNSISINPLDFIKNEKDINKVATHLVHSSMGDKSSDPFWSLSAIGMLKTFLGLLKLQPKQYQTIGMLRYMLDGFNANPQALHLMATKAPPRLYTEYKALIKSNEKTLKSVLLTCTAALNLWGDNGVCKITETTTFDINKFRDTPSVLYLRNATMTSSYYQPLLSLLLEQLFTVFTEKLPTTELPLYFVIDEASTLNLPSMPLFISNARKYKISLMLLFQALGQVYNNWGTEGGAIILANCHNKLFYGGMDLKTSNDLSDLLGKRMVVTREGKDMIMDLMLAQDVRMLKRNEALFFCGANKPYKLDNMVPYYDNPHYRKRSQGQPFVYTNPDFDKPLPLLKLYEGKGQ